MVEKNSAVVCKLTDIDGIGNLEIVEVVNWFFDVNILVDVIEIMMFDIYDCNYVHFFYSSIYKKITNQRSTK